MFLGTSPEFEMALYTLCFCAGQEENIVFVGDYEVKIKAYRIRSKYGDKVGSTYPEVRQCLSFCALAVRRGRGPGYTVFCMHCWHIRSRVGIL